MALNCRPDPCPGNGKEHVIIEQRGAGKTSSLTHGETHSETRHHRSVEQRKELTGVTTRTNRG